LNPTTNKSLRRIGIDLSVLDRVKTGTSVYAECIYGALKNLSPDDIEFVPLKAPRPMRRKNILTKIVNLGIEVTWLTAILPFRARRLHLDLVHFPANIISPTMRIPQVCTIHDAHFLTYPQGRDPLWSIYAHWSFRYAARHADRIICDSNSGKDEIVNLLGAEPENIDVVYLGLPNRKSKPSDQEAAASLKPYILSVGATDPNKNLPAAVRAFARLLRADQHAGHKLVIAGPPGRDQPLLESIIREENIGDHVRLLGRVSDSMLAALYENASLFVFPSFCEGFGFPPLEAMSFGIPVVASHAPCIPETLGDAALYFDPYDIEEFTARIHDVLSDPKLHDRLASTGLERSSKFQWSKTAASTVDIYRNSLLEFEPACQDIS